MNGREVIEGLAETYRQLYLIPGEEGEAEYPDIVTAGEDPEDKDLSHFITNEKDSLSYMETPAGRVCVITLYERQDFITFLQIMANRCKKAVIPDTQGASILSGVINWRKIEAHQDEFIRQEKEKGVESPDWDQEFSRFTSDKSNYRDTLIVLSVGPYSNVAGSELGYDEDEWIRLSNTIRLYHEGTHFVCRKRFPDKKDAVWDELVADAVGIYAALGSFDPSMEERFLGIKDGRYIGGRLENYVKGDLDTLSQRISGILNEFKAISSADEDIPPFELALILEESMDRLWSA